MDVPVETPETLNYISSSAPKKLALPCRPIFQRLAVIFGEVPRLCQICNPQHVLTEGGKPCVWVKLGKRAGGLFFCWIRFLLNSFFCSIRFFVDKIVGLR